MITKEQASEIKSQLIAHIESTFPEDKKTNAIERVTIMDEVELEDFVIKNGLLQGSDKKFAQDCVFCHIASGGIKSVKISENEDALVVLEINPISRGHILIVPKRHSPSIEDEKETFDSIQTLQKNIIELLKEKLNPKDVLIASSVLFGHETISLVPQYEDETLESERHAASQEELKEIQTILSLPKPKQTETKKKEPKRSEKSKDEETKKEETKDSEEKVEKEKPKSILEFFHIPRRIP